MYVLKGSVPPDFRMIKINKIKYIGDMETNVNAERQGGTSDTASGQEGLNMPNAESE